MKSGLDRLEIGCWEGKYVRLCFWVFDDSNARGREVRQALLLGFR